MTKLLIFLLFAFSLCFAETTKKTETDSIKETVKELKTEQKEFKNSIDSLNSKFLSDNFITIKALKEIQELHNIAFDKMQGSFNIFLIAIGLIITLATLFNIKNTNDLKKEVKEELKKIKDFENKIVDLETKLKDEIKNQKNEFEINMKEQIESQKTEFDKMKEEYQDKFDVLSGLVSDRYYTLSLENIKKGDIYEYFFKYVLFLL